MEKQEEEEEEERKKPTENSFMNMGSELFVLLHLFFIPGYGD